MTQISLKLTISLLLIMALQFLNLQHHVDHLNTDVSLIECTVCHHSGNIDDIVPPKSQFFIAFDASNKASNSTSLLSNKSVTQVRFFIRGPPKDYPISTITT